MFLKCLLNLKTSNDSNSPDQATVMQGKGFSGFVRLVMDAHYIVLLI